MSEIKVPDGWESIELEKILEYEQPTKYLVSSENYNNSYKTPVLTAGKTFILGYTDETEGIFNKELPVLIFDDFTTASKYVNFPFKAKSSAMKILKIRDNTIDIKIVFELMQRLNFKPEEHKRHWISTYSKLKINLPKSKDEQQKIAEILSEVDSAITLTKELIEKNKRLKTALMQDLLSYGIDENGQIRSPQTHQFKPSPLGNIPVEWDYSEFDNILSVIDGDRGSNYPIEVDFYQDEYCMFLNAKNVTKNGFDFSEKSFITKEKNSKLGKGKLKRNDFILTTRGTVGNIAYFNQYIPFEHLRINSGMVILRPLNQDIIGSFFFEFLKSDFFNLQKNQVIFGSAQPQLTVKQIQKFILIFPKSKQEQQKIADILSSQDEKIEKLQNKLTKLNHLKTSLMQDLLSGKIRVNKLLESKQ